MWSDRSGRTRSSIVLATIIVGAAHAAAGQSTQGEFWPKIDLCINGNSQLRVWTTAEFTYQPAPITWTGNFGTFLDFALNPVFRRELREHDDAFSRRYLSFRGGYQYIANLRGPSYNENRAIVELTGRARFPGGLVASSRNRGEMRFIRGQPFSTRYRNLLRLERDVRVGRLTTTPFVDMELFYDTRYGEWNRVRYSAGLQFPTYGGHMVVETYFTRENNRTSQPRHVDAAVLRFTLFF